jgi:hypothetical protein
MCLSVAFVVTEVKGEKLNPSREMLGFAISVAGMLMIGVEKETSGNIIPNTNKGELCRFFCSGTE